MVLVLVIIGAIWLIGVPNSPWNPAPNPKTHLKAGYFSVIYYLPLLVAKEKGFFEEEGLDVELVKFENANQIMDALLQGKIQEGTGGYSTLFAIESNTPGQFKMFGHAFETEQKNQNALLIPANSDIRDINELRGKRIGTYTGTTQKLYLGQILHKLGWKEGTDYEIVQVATNIQLSALAAGQFDALLTIEPFVTTSQEQGIGKVLVSNPRGKFILDPFPSGPLGTFSSEELRKDPGALEKMRRAIEKAAVFIETNESEARQIMPKYLPLDENAAMHVGLYEFKTKPDKSQKQGTQKLADLLFDGNELKNRIDTAAMGLPGN